MSTTAEVDCQDDTSGDLAVSAPSKIKQLKKVFEPLDVVNPEEKKEAVGGLSKTKRIRLNSQNRSCSEDNFRKTSDSEIFETSDVTDRVKLAKSVFLQIDQSLQGQTRYKNSKLQNFSSKLSDTRRQSLPTIISENNNNVKYSNISIPKSNVINVPSYAKQTVKPVENTEVLENVIQSESGVQMRSTIRKNFSEDTYFVKRKAGFWQDRSSLLGSHINVVSQDFDSEGIDSVSDDTCFNKDEIAFDTKSLEDVFLTDGEDKESNGTDLKKSEINNPLASTLDQNTYYIEIEGLSDSEENKTSDESSSRKPRVKFDKSPIKMYFTYTPEEYSRVNPYLDPVSASAEFELEKRIEKMEVYEVDIEKGSEGLGIRIVGFGVGADCGLEKLGIFIKSLSAGGAMARNGRVAVGDQIIQVNETSLIGVSQSYASEVLRSTVGCVKFLMGRIVDESGNDIRELLELPPILPAKKNNHSSIIDSSTTEPSTAVCQNEDEIKTTHTKLNSSEGYVNDKGESENKATVSELNDSVCRSSELLPTCVSELNNKGLTSCNVVETNNVEMNLPKISQSNYATQSTISDHKYKDSEIQESKQLVDAITKCKLRRDDLQTEIVDLKIKLAQCNHVPNEIERMKQMCDDTKNLLYNGMLENGNLADERDSLWTAKTKLSEFRKRLVAEKYEFEIKCLDTMKTVDVACKKQHNLELEIEAQEKLVKEVVENNNALQEMLIQLQLEIDLLSAKKVSGNGIHKGLQIDESDSNNNHDESSLAGLADITYLTFVI